MLTVLIGPPGSGKSTVGALVAQMTARPFVEADVASTPWYAGEGWTRLTADGRSRWSPRWRG